MTEIIVVSRKETPPNINIYINDTKLQQRDQFKYLGALISSDGRDTTEISSRIAQSKTMFKRMKKIFTNPHMSIETRKSPRVLHRTHIDVRMRDLDNIKTNARQAVLDFTTYYLNITEANLSGELIWKPEYTAKRDLEMKGLYAADWVNLIDRMETNDDLFQRFYSYYLALQSDSPCIGQCKSDLLCQLREGRSYDPNLCDRQRLRH
ncbi:sphingomyelin phosphodiesterase [Elysia marginata]|uniref:Sphingomyelin phosphodiesterase n=1 Tax=Elysia marginata TaxID=1093978 RepID=A0AAV4JHX0_9GAST|nr:sphingomyelin phosphodiesterase [Elysia marginata]